jgi:type IV pilus assembly protein PilP
MKTLFFLIFGLIFALGLAAQDSGPTASPPAQESTAIEAPPVPPPPEVTTATTAESSEPPAPPASPPPGVPEVPLPPGSESFVYDPAGKRDPFQPEPDKSTPQLEGTPVQGRRLPTPAPLPQREREPLESFDLFQLKVSAIIWDTKNPRAMLIDPVGNTHVVKLKTRVGKNNGFVVAIREGEVVVVEYNAELDQWVKSFKVLELR